MEQKYDPPKSLINKLLESRTPEQLAVAYLRSQHRLRKKSDELVVLETVMDLSIAVDKGEGENAVKAGEKLERILRSMKQTNEGQKR